MMTEWEPVGYLLEGGIVLPVPDPWGDLPPVDPFTGQPDHQHGDAAPGRGTSDGHETEPGHAT